ncbi:hypothetical protein OG226_12530 [Streptomyces sp. NBC_01261]|uniref:hypothetical protein n=1 Tax=Streptomyces sp. NBC_01261 TaxID=2903802 RepID=UPI002E359C0E|nr:hypothetical protein [Streptomyces sp. NBC_01261]
MSGNSFFTRGCWEGPTVGVPEGTAPVDDEPDDPGHPEHGRDEVDEVPVPPDAEASTISGRRVTIAVPIRTTSAVQTARPRPRE